MRLLSLASLLVVLAAACGSSSAETEAEPTGTTSQNNGSGGTTPAQSGEPPPELMALANGLRDEYTQLKSEHERLWQERIRIATGPDLEAIGPRYASVSADFTALADRAWQEMSTAVGHVQQGNVDGFRHFINLSRRDVSTMRQAVEAIQAELAQMGSVPAPAPEEPAP
jgi:hypothetical protein